MWVWDNKVNKYQLVCPRIDTLFLGQMSYERTKPGLVVAVDFLSVFDMDVFVFPGACFV